MLLETHSHRRQSAPATSRPWRRVSTVLDPMPVDGTCRPRLYVYRLPEGYRDPSEAGNGLPADGLGRPLRLHASGIENGLWDADQYSLASLMYERALSFRCRTHDPAAADVFFVPAFKPRLGTEQSCAEPAATSGHRGSLLGRLKMELPNSSRPADWGSRSLASSSLEVRGGADHIILNPRSGASWERYPFCELTLGHHAFGAAMYLAMEQAPRNGSWVYPEGYCGKVCVDAYYPQLVSESWYWSVPWTSTVHLDINSGSTPPWASSHARKYLVAANFGMLHRPVLPKPTLQLRDRLAKQCRAKPTRCLFTLPSTPERTALLYWDATFCARRPGANQGRDQRAHAHAHCTGVAFKPTPLATHCRGTDPCPADARPRCRALTLRMRKTPCLQACSPVATPSRARPSWTLCYSGASLFSSMRASAPNGAGTGARG